MNPQTDRPFDEGHLPPGVTPPAATDPDRIGFYRVVGRIGAGGMGAVYAGLGEDDGSCAAVKVVHGRFAADPDFRGRFAREVAMVARVRSVCTPAFLAADPAAEVPWLATEYVAGDTLRVYVRKNGPLAGGMLDALAAGLAEALTAIHAAGVVHRDLKPGNVILAPSGPKVLDFGIARAVDGTALTRTGGLFGTPGWMAPEQFAGRPATDRSDVFAWAGLVLFAATGRDPFGTGPVSVVSHRTRTEEPDLTGVPEHLARLLRRAFDKEPGGRPTALEALTELTAGWSATRIAQAPDPSAPNPPVPGASAPDPSAQGPSASNPPVPGASAPGAPAAGPSAPGAPAPGAPAPGTPAPGAPLAGAPATAIVPEMLRQEWTGVSAPRPNRVRRSRRPGRALLLAAGAAALVAVLIGAFLVARPPGGNTGADPSADPTAAEPPAAGGPTVAHSPQDGEAVVAEAVELARGASSFVAYHGDAVGEVSSAGRNEQLLYTEDPEPRYRETAYLGPSTEHVLEIGAGPDEVLMRIDSNLAGLVEGRFYRAEPGQRIEPRHRWNLAMGALEELIGGDASFSYEGVSDTPFEGYPDDFKEAYDLTGRTGHHYTGTLRTEDEVYSYEGTFDLWIGEDGYPQHFQSFLRFGEAEEDYTTRTVGLVAFGVPVEIEVPAESEIAASAEEGMPSY